MRKKYWKQRNRAATKDGSVNVAIAAALSELGGIVTLKEGQRRLFPVEDIFILLLLTGLQRRVPDVTLHIIKEPGAVAT